MCTIYCMAAMSSYNVMWTGYVHLQFNFNNSTSPVLLTKAVICCHHGWFDSKEKRGNASSMWQHAQHKGKLIFEKQTSWRSSRALSEDLLLLSLVDSCNTSLVSPRFTNNLLTTTILGFLWLQPTIRKSKPPASLLDISSTD